MASDSRPAADVDAAPPRRLVAWISLVALVALGLALGVRHTPLIVPYITVEADG